MASTKEPSSLRALLPKVLAGLAQDSGRAFALVPVWGALAGPQLARACRPLRLEGNTLVFAVQNAEWGKRLDELQTTLCPQLSQRRGFSVQRFRWEVGQ